MTDSHVPAATTPVQLRPVDRYDLSDAILAAWHKHGNNSWCSIADEVIAALSAPQQGVPAVDWEWIEEVYHEQRGGDYHMRESQFASAVEIVLARYAAHAVPVAVAERRPSLGDCDERGYCWLYDDGAYKWEWATAHSLDPDGHSHWLPHYALPLPEAQP